MVLAGFGIQYSEAELCRICDCTMFGTEAFQAVEAARSLGFLKTSKYNLTLKDLTILLLDEHYPIVYIELQPIDQTFGTHAMVILSIDEMTVHVLDPMAGERALTRTAFEMGWALTKGLTIVVDR
jgi:ABC-type bacteriocin/lantibiotic exporter with double-glycine peptidase domain